MRGIHHHARFRGHGRQVVERVQAHLPRRMQISCRAAHDEERLACREPIAIGSRACDFAPALFGDTSRHRHAREHARLAREELHLTPLGTNAQNLAREVNIRNVFGNELVDSRIGYAQHVFPFMRLRRDNYSCFRIAVLAAGASFDARWWPLVAERLGHERETPSLNVGWLLTLQQTQGFVAARHPIPGADMIFRCGTLAANRRRRPCERLHGIPCSKPSQKRPEPKPGQSPSQKHSTETQSEVSAKALSNRGRRKRSAENATMGPHCRLSSPNWQKTPLWGPK